MVSHTRKVKQTVLIVSLWSVLQMVGFFVFGLVFLYQK